jgi:hypothetical protein
MNTVLFLRGFAIQGLISFLAEGNEGGEVMVGTEVKK